MTPREFCSSGNAEGIKLAAHSTLGTICALCAAYNIVAWYYRRDTHLAVNSVVYGLATAWEVSKSKHHLESWENQ